MSLGVGAYRFLVYERGAGRFVADLTEFTSSYAFKRQRNAITPANLDFTWPQGARGAVCAGTVARVEPWAHELAIVRDGIEVWVGPVTHRPMVLGKTGQLVAFDLGAWLDVRFARFNRDYSVSGIAASTFVAQMLDDALLVDDPGLRTWCVVHSIPEIVHNKIVATDDQLVWSDVLEPLCSGVISYTAVGRALTFWPSQTALGYVRAPIINEDLLGFWPMEQDGSAYASRIAVHGADVVRAVAGGTSARYGLVERRLDVNTLGNNSEALTVAGKNVAIRPPFVLIGDSATCQLSCDASVDFSHLIPGAAIRLNFLAGTEVIDQTFTLDGVNVSGGGGVATANGPEAVAITVADTNRVEWK